MKPVDQSIVDPKRGDCFRASIASLFELELEQVPHFKLFKDKWFPIYNYFIRSLGWEYEGYAFPKTHKISETCNVNGYLCADVPSRTFPNIGHSVVIDLKGVVVHDPNPNRLWQGVNVLESGELTGWHLLEKRPLSIDADAGVS